MDLVAQMATFVRVVDTGSFSAAARARKLSLAAVSRQIAALESELGVSLIARTTRRLAPTEAGQRWYAHCLRVLREVDDARASVGQGGAVRGTLVVSAGVTIGAHFVVPRLRALQRKHPGLQVELRLEDRPVDLVGDVVDVAIRAGLTPPDRASLVAHKLRTFPRIVVASPAYLRAHGTPRQPEQLASHRCLIQLGSAGANTPWRLVHAATGEERSVAVQGSLRITMTAALHQLAREGGGLALLPPWLVARDTTDKILRHLLPAWRTPPVTMWALYRTESRGSPLVHAFVEALGPRTEADEPAV